MQSRKGPVQAINHDKIKPDPARLLPADISGDL